VKLFALTFGDPATPSSHFRLHQYAQAFHEQGVVLEHAVAKGFEDWERLGESDLVLLELTLLPAGKIRRLRRHARVLVYDACDRIWLRPGREYDWLARARQRHRLRATVRAADLCLAANGVIAADLRAAGARRVELLPMSVDTEAWNAIGRPEPDGTVTIGWSGSPGNLAFLEPLVPTLRKLREQYDHVRIAIHCGRKPDFAGLDFVHHPFEAGREPEAVRTFDIGLLPLPDDPFVHGKSPIKALQYFACGAAVVGQGVGATAELLRHDIVALTVNDERSWETNLRRLVEDGALRERLVAAGRAELERAHTLSAVFERFVTLLRSAGSAATTAR
jgi:glycosyltransferase involved in cell wall biosynthesis